MNSSNLDSVFISQRTSLLRTLLKIVKNTSIAEELVQETYLRVARTVRDKPIDHLEPFLFQTGRNLALDHLRRERMQSRTMLDDVPNEVVEAVAAPASSSEDSLHAARLLQHLGSALDQLSSRQQRIFAWLARACYARRLEPVLRTNGGPASDHVEMQTNMRVWGAQPVLTGGTRPARPPWFRM